jgi:Amt family ammonium transporter
MNETTLNILSQNIDTLWVINCAILVFIMQAGFMCMESGLSRHKNSINVALKNAADFGVSVVMFWLFGFGLMFGTSYKGIIGTDLFFFKTNISEYQTYFVFQAMFVATAATIISGAVAERMKFAGYLIVTIVATAIIYPIIGHWAWSSSYLSKLYTDVTTNGSSGWLTEMGFVDFAGSTIVHSVGGWIALAGVLILGPRIGRFSSCYIRYVNFMVWMVWF